MCWGPTSSATFWTGCPAAGFRDRARSRPPRRLPARGSSTSWSARSRQPRTRISRPSSCAGSRGSHEAILDNAARDFRATLRLSPEFFPAAFYLGACYAAGGRDDEAAGAWQTSLVTEAEAPFVYEVLGDALLRLDEGQQAADILKEAHTLWPSDDRFARRLAVAHAAARQHAEAIALLETHLAAHPDDRQAWLLGAWLIYDARLAGRPIGTTSEADVARLQRYRERYAAAGGTELGLVDQWEKAIKNK